MPVDAGQQQERAVFGTVTSMEEGRSLLGRQRMLLQRHRAAAAVLPEGWFELHSLDDAGFDRGGDHTMLDRIGGPPVSSFHVWRHEGRVHVRALPELDQDVGETPWAGCFRDIAEAVEAIGGVIEAQLRAWTLPSRIPCAGHP